MKTTNPRTLLAYAGVALLAGVTIWSVAQGRHASSVPGSGSSGSAADLSGIVAPPMPPAAVDKHEQGTCSVWTKFNVLGLAESVEVVHSSGCQDLDDYTVAWGLTHWKGPPNVRVQSNCHYDWHDPVKPASR